MVVYSNVNSDQPYFDMEALKENIKAGLNRIPVEKRARRLTEAIDYLIHGGPRPAFYHQNGDVGRPQLTDAQNFCRHSCPQTNAASVLLKQQTMHKRHINIQKYIQT
uniref:Uncharacterized protein n=1 Tax=Helobdella robusta TaxID=6412 RepID=T1FL08_HELRO